MGFFGDLFKKAEPTNVTVKGSGETFVVQPGVNLMKAAIAAKVAWPQRSISINGENHFILNPLLSLATKAVSERLFSRAIFCILCLVKSDEKITPAGLPSKSVFVNESTWYKSNLITAL
mgnify:CR=1 FL=1